MKVKEKRNLINSVLLSKKHERLKWGTQHQEDQDFFNNEIIYYLLTVEQYRGLHIHSKDSLKHVVILKMHVLTVVKSTILYVLTQDLHWHIYINIWKTELHTLIFCPLFRLCLPLGRWPPTLVVNSNIPRAPILETRGKGKFGSQVKWRTPPQPPTPLERIGNQNKISG